MEQLANWNKVSSLDITIIGVNFLIFDNSTAFVEENVLARK